MKIWTYFILFYIILFHLVFFFFYFVLFYFFLFDSVWFCFWIIIQYPPYNSFFPSSHLVLISFPLLPFYPLYPTSLFFPHFFTAIFPFISTCFGNPSSPHIYAKPCREAVVSKIKYDIIRKNKIKIK